MIPLLVLVAMIILQQRSQRWTMHLLRARIRSQRKGLLQKTRTSRTSGPPMHLRRQVRAGLNSVTIALVRRRMRLGRGGGGACAGAGGGSVVVVEEEEEEEEG